MIGSLFTDVYHSLSLGTDRNGLILVTFVAAHLALGASSRTRWSFALPPLLAAIGLLVARTDQNPWVALWLICGVPTGLLLIVIGRSLAAGGRRVGDGRLAPVIVPAVLFVVALAPVAEAAREAHS